jgi:DNA-binding response OmpR family regulator
MARILLIDDEADLREFLTRALRIRGHEVTSASSGRVITQPAEGARSAADFDLIITDIVMPDAEGLETIIAAKKASAATKVIAISGGGRSRPSDYLRHARHLGADAALRKPFSTAELFQTVEDALRPV